MKSNHLYHAEVKYVFRFFSSRQVFLIARFKRFTKIFTKIYALTKYKIINIRLIYAHIKSFIWWFSGIFCVRNDCLRGPAVVGQHIVTPFALVPLFHSRNLPKKVLTMYIRDSPRFSGTNPGETPRSEFSKTAFFEQPISLYDVRSSLTISL